MNRMTPGPWFTDGLIVWAHSAGGPAICAARNLEAREGTFAPVESAEEQRANMQACAAVPALVEALKRARLDYVATLEAGRDRILSFGGTCDAVDVMERGDPALKRIDAALALLTTPAPPP